MKSGLTREQIRALIKEGNIKNTGDIANVLKDIFSDTLQEMLEAELDDTLGYGKNERKAKGTTNRRNGHSKKTVSSQFGESELAVPRDRDGEHEPIIVGKHQRNLSGIEEQIIAMYSKGMTTRDIQDHLHQLYGVEISPTLVSNVTNKLMPLIREWQSRPLERVYAVAFMDAIHFKVRQEGMIVNKAAYMIIGINMEGMKDVLGIWIGEAESAKFWLSVLNELRNRGVEDILICSVDNLKGFSEAIKACFPETEIQKCIVHQVRNCTKYVNYKDLKPFTKDMRRIYNAASEEQAVAELEMFDQVWGKKYPLAIKSWRTNWAELSAAFKYPPELRRIIYTTNIIESYHRQLRKTTKVKAILPNDDALTKILYLVTMEVTRKWVMRVPNWGSIILQLSVFFPDRVRLP